MEESSDPTTLSKNAQKKLAKLEAINAAKAAKETDQANNKVEKAEKAEKVEELDPHAYRENRIAALTTYTQTTGLSLYPNRFTPTQRIQEYVTEYANQLENGEMIEDDEILVAGRIESIRESSKKLYFFHIAEDNVRIQILANQMFYRDQAHFPIIMDLIKRGDIVGIIGLRSRSKRGELSVVPREIRLLSPCLQLLPPAENELKKVEGLKDRESRFRQRYLDLLVNQHTRKIFVARSIILSTLRSVLNNLGFLEVETPMMNVIPGGAIAKPFMTYHNELKMNLFMRIAPELYLKQLVIGGFDRVYEIGKNFRNEGIDMTHNPEFTACEFYMAYANYEQLMDLTEQLLATLVKSVNNGSLLVTYQREENQEPLVIDFTPPFRRFPMIETLQQKLGFVFPTDLESEETRLLLIKTCQEHDPPIDCAPPQTTARLLDKLTGALIEPDCVQPAFITKQPRMMSPLAKPDENNPQVTERFELFVAGWEICNSYTELNDPRIQEDRFKQQAQQKEAGDEEAQPVDQDFVTALEHALPPTAGWGMGIDRLVMLLTNQTSIREVIFFPTMKPI